MEELKKKISDEELAKQLGCSVKELRDQRNRFLTSMRVAIPVQVAKNGEAKPILVEVSEDGKRVSAVVEADVNTTFKLINNIGKR